VHKAWLHIGAPKTATSLIQGLLNEQDSRDIVEPYYDTALCKLIQSHMPTYDMNDYFLKQAYDDIKARVPQRDIVLSVENVFGMHTHSKNNYDQSVDVIKHLFQGFDIKVLFFVRRQDTYLESIYNQDVKRGETRTFKKFCDDAVLDNLYWTQVADNYSCFDLTVRPFEKKVLRTGGYKDFLDALYKWLGYDVVVESSPLINASLSRPALDVQRLGNELLTQEQSYALGDWLARHCPKQPDDKHSLMAAEDSYKIVHGFCKSNQSLFKKYMPEFNPAYYEGGKYG
jgi:hypothetical protein